VKASDGKEGHVFPIPIWPGWGEFFRSEGRGERRPAAGSEGDATAVIILSEASETANFSRDLRSCRRRNCSDSRFRPLIV